MPRSMIRVLLCVVLWWTTAGNGLGAEPWADQSLKIQDGLVVWLDASVQPAAWRARGDRPQLVDKSPLDVWFDGSGKKWDFTASSESSYPQYSSENDRSSVRFDGTDDFLQRINGDLQCEDFTAFIVASATSNSGNFRAFLCAGAQGKNDYQSGFNIDQGPFESVQFEVINVEGDGFGGVKDLWDGVPQPLGTFHLIEASASEKTVQVIVDGMPPGSTRERETKPLSLDVLTLGARQLVTGRPFQGCLHGDIAEVLLYNRALSLDETSAVREYLLTKYKETIEISTVDQMVAKQQLHTVEAPPPVQVFVPGFMARQLPVELSNINNLQYREDGKLYALAYDGTIYLLSDHSGDGLEDTAEVFWKSAGQLRGPIGMDLTPPGYPQGQGVFVTSKGLCSLIVDTDGDGRADEQITVADGWKEIGHGVDGLGVAFDKRDGSVWFGIGTQNFTNGYLVNDKGEADYSLTSERGTILRVAPDFKSRQIACTGIRFPVAMRFNAAGDLFCTDQEGATWLPNGNPFDELLHIEMGRHYGFPPAHPKHLPNVIDEPSTFDYGPQHQSTCGFNFNEPVVDDGSIFGPDAWRGDALVTGYSRGKIYRTQLIKTPAGYVAQNQLLACLNMLPADACISPQGDLVIATHSGSPDWGSGPAGSGKLFKVSYSDRERPQPVTVWAAGPRQVQVAFDRPLSPEDLAGVSTDVRITHGPWVRAGDRFESLRPGYAVVQRQMISDRRDLPVHGVQVTPDRRTLILDTAAHTTADHCGLTLQGLGRPARAKNATVEEIAAGCELPQSPETDLHYTLHGVTAHLSQGGQVIWEGWLPHLDTRVNQRFTQGSASHDELRSELNSADRLTLRTQLDLHHMLRPEVQPGSTIDFDYLPEQVTIVLRSASQITVKSEAGSIEIGSDSTSGSSVRLIVDKPTKEWIPLEIMLRRQGAREQLDLTAVWFTSEDARERPFPLRRFFLPWAQPAEPTGGAQSWVAGDIPELEGGSWHRGRAVFFGEQANCSKCHQLQGTGGHIGPDLSNLSHRDYHSVLRDIVHPSFAINPDHLAYTIMLSDGQVLTGLVRQEEGQLIVGTTKAEEVRIDPKEVERMVPATISIMPTGIDEALGPDKLRDLMTFLLGTSPSMPNDRAGGPPPRSRAEVERALAGAPPADSDPRPMQVVLVAGAKDHGPGEHDYPAWLRAWKTLFEAANNVVVTTAMDWPEPEAFETADAIVFYQQGKWNEQRASDIDKFLKRGGGVSYIHYAVDGGTDPAGFAERIGLAWKGGGSKFRHGALDMLFKSNHPITRNINRLQLEDESYWQLVGDTESIDILGSGREDDAMQPLIWCHEREAGRVFVSIPGHYSWTFDDPLFRILVLRGIAWTARQPVDRFNELIYLGAAVREKTSGEPSKSETTE